MSKAMKVFAVAFAVLTVIFAAVYPLYENTFVLAMGITFGTFSYHLWMRLIVGGMINVVFKNRMNYMRWWFRERRFEKGLYEFLRVKKWKKYAPTYHPDTFSIEKHSLEEIIMATCQSEIVHETIVLLSFLPLLLAIPFGEFFVFFFTSLSAAIVDALFVILQRYNRPRLIKILKRMQNDR